MLSENNTIETSSLISTGNSELLATTKHQIGVNLSYNNFYMQISKKWISDIPDYIPVGYNGSILVKKWMNIGKQDLWVLHSSYSVRFNRVYINPNINIEFGRFFDAVQWIKNSFATITIPFLYHYNRHKIQIDASFIPKSHFYNTTTDAMIVLNARYTIGLLKDQLTLKIFANDIFNSLSSEKNKFQAKDFISRTSLHKDKRQIGISISYNFSQGKMKFFEGVRNNINRNK